MSRLTDRDGRPTSGTQPTAVVGIVTDNVDPDELGRIQVKFPTLHGEPLSFWLRQISPMAGKERGLYSLPEKDDEVLVMFMQGSQDVGVIVGQMWNGVDIPPQECKDAMPVPDDTLTKAPKGARSEDTFTDGSKDLQSNDRRFWKSRSGHLMVMDDTGGAETIQIWDKSHTLALVFETTEQRIVLSNNAGDIHIRCKNDLWLDAGNDMKITVGNDMDTLVHNDQKTKVDMNIEVESGMDSTWKAGMNFKQTAKMNWDAKADMNAKMEGSMNADVKGGIQAKMEGGAMAVVKGGLVMIN